MSESLDTIESLMEHQTFLRRIARALVHDDATAEDLVQDVWVRALESPPQARGKSRGWLVRVAQNVARQNHRTKQRREARDREISEETLEEPTDAIAEQLELERLIIDAVQSLKSPYRDAVFLRFFRGLGHQAIGKQLGVPAATARTHLRRGLMMIRTRLERTLKDRPNASALLVAMAKYGADPVSALASVSFLTGKKLLAVAAVALVVATTWLNLTPSNVGPSEEGTALGVLPKEALTPTVRPAPTREPIETAPASLAPQERADESIYGRVVDTLGNPIEEATVQLFEDMYAKEKGAAALAEFQTNEFGEFEISLPDCRFPSIHVHKPGFTHTSTWLDARRPPFVVGTFCLSESRTVTGIVRNQSGAPIEGAWVQSALEERVIPFDPSSTRTDEEGRFTLRDVPLFPVTLNVFAKGYGPTRTGQLPIERSSVELSLSPMDLPRVTLKVLTADGDPIPGARSSVNARWAGSNWPMKIPGELIRRFSDADGVIEFPFLPAGRYKFNASKNNQSLVATDYVALREGESRSFTIQARPSIKTERLEGVLLDERERPLAGQTIRWSAGYYGSGEVATTDDEGRFQITPPVATGKRFFVRLDSDQLILAGSDVRGGVARIKAQPGAVLTWKAVPGARVTGKVVYGDSPVMGRTVKMLGPAHGARRDFARARTDRHGRFQFPPVPLGVKFRLRVEGGPEDFTAPKRWISSADELADEMIIALPRTASVSGRVLQPNGEPAVGIVVRGEGQKTATNSSGQYSLTGLTDENQTLTISSSIEEDKVSVQLERGKRREGFDIRLKESDPSTISGIVRYEDGSPVLSAHLGAGLSPEPSVIVGNVSSGRFKLQGLEPEQTYSIRAWSWANNDAATYFFLRSNEIRVESGGTNARLVIDRSQVSEVIGRIDPTSPLAALRQLYCRLKSKVGSGAIRPEVVGSKFRLPGLSPGTYELSFGDGRETLYRMNLDVGTGELIDIGLIPTAPIQPSPKTTGVIADSDGRPLEGVIVREALFATHFDGMPPNALLTESGADGAFQVTYRPEQRLEFFKVGYAPCILVAQPDPMNVTLERAGDVEVRSIPSELNDIGRWTFWALYQEGTVPKGSSKATSAFHPPEVEKSFRFRGLLPGRWVIHIWRSDLTTRPPDTPKAREAYRFEVKIVAGEVAIIDMREEW